MEGLALGLVVADEVELLGRGGGLRGVGRRLDLLPGRLGAIRVEGADVCAGLVGEIFIDHALEAYMRFRSWWWQTAC